MFSTIWRRRLVSCSDCHRGHVLGSPMLLGAFPFCWGPSATWLITCPGTCICVCISNPLRSSQTVPFASTPDWIPWSCTTWFATPSTYAASYSTSEHDNFFLYPCKFHYGCQHSPVLGTTLILYFQLLMLHPELFKHPAPPSPLSTNIPSASPHCTQIIQQVTLVRKISVNNANHEMKDPGLQVTTLDCHPK